ncbi:MAG: hypothetical protein ACI4A7_02985 [Prevotella sp.]
MRIIQKIGNEKLLKRETTLFICSKLTPIALYPVIFNWVESLDERDCVMCFKTTEMEYEVMSALLVREIPTILFVTNKFTDVNNIQIEKALQENRLLIIVLKRDEPKGAGTTPLLRNTYVIGMANRIVAGYVNPNGHVFGQLAGRQNIEKLMERPVTDYAEEAISTSKRWTVREDKILLRMFYEDKGLHAIKKRINRPYSSVRQRISAITMPEKMLKGREFEDYVIEELLHIGSTGSDAKLIEWRSDKSLEGVFPETNRLPDLVVSFKRKKKVALECKWRRTILKSVYNELITNEKDDIFKQYSTENGIDVWYIIGVGGEPSAPEELYLIPLSATSKVMSDINALRNYMLTGQITIKNFDKPYDLT